MDITRRFGRRIVGSSPAGRTKIKIPESLIVVRLFDEIRTYFERN